MSVLKIRAHKRYALRVPARIKGEGRKPAQCLLIELSSAGVRISNLGEGKFAEGDAVVVQTDCGKALEGTIRWAHDGLAGVNLVRPLHLPEMSEIILPHRREFGDQGELQYAV